MLFEMHERQDDKPDICFHFVGDVHACVTIPSGHKRASLLGQIDHKQYKSNFIVVPTIGMTVPESSFVPAWAVRTLAPESPELPTMEPHAQWRGFQFRTQEGDTINFSAEVKFLKPTAHFWNLVEQKKSVIGPRFTFRVCGIDKSIVSRGGAGPQDAPQRSGDSEAKGHKGVQDRSETRAVLRATRTCSQNMPRQPPVCICQTEAISVVASSCFGHVSFSGSGLLHFPLACLGACLPLRRWALNPTEASRWSSREVQFSVWRKNVG